MSSPRPTFFTSDLHLNEEGIINLDGRPWNSSEEMNEGLVRRYNATVPENGICYFLGDIGRKDVGKYIRRMNGTKVCILGNHDSGVTSMLNKGFDAVMHEAILIIAGEELTLTHCPLKGVFREDVTGMKGAIEGELWHGESRHMKFSTEDRGQFHLHGHIHSPNSGKSTKILNRQYDIGVVANNYQPVSFGQIESWINKTKKEEQE